MPEALKLNQEEQLIRSSQMKQLKTDKRINRFSDKIKSGKLFNKEQVNKGLGTFDSIKIARSEKSAKSYADVAKSGLELTAQYSQDQKSRQLSEEDQFNASKELLRLIKAAENENQFQAYSEAARVGINFRNQINKNKLDGGTFISILLLSIIGDLIDIITLGTIGYFADKVVAIALFFIFFLQSSVIKKWLIKRYAWPIVIKFIPFGNFFPSYTMGAILLKLKINKKNKALLESAEKVEKEYKKYNPKVVYE
ncbi:MAG: hypothetical protein UT48_C0049G0002 [Parcubacteria group bacterium GW2011_GWE2_39_37]|uniref:Uncharacterized protein n=1 Tax=Candidatus Falkowbacteria bacterium GW2011_GWF2_39_8 TaxID=1618642 RepID=A0A0G0PY96_9BACT|nr:MAG: hypothetical protein UT48_C0049G0002 [Parcubacteria group bacterium GW2011_GWE2_39_37]KKR32868.1 MAG: hypothetical protein UT64_C0020G0003 [Candidatus Falkowbacteria bacterium GW2011_GWF2_39_8]